MTGKASYWVTWFRERFEEWLARDGGDRRGSIGRFADRVGRKPSTISQWMRDAARPDEYGCQLLARALGLPLEEVRTAAGRVAATPLREGPATYDPDGDRPSDVLAAELRHALGPDYNLLASLKTTERQELLRTLAAIWHHWFDLHRRVREPEHTETA